MCHENPTRCGPHLPFKGIGRHGRGALLQHHRNLYRRALAVHELKLERKLNNFLLKAAWGAFYEVLGVDDRELAAIFTLQTAGEALTHFRTCTVFSLMVTGRLAYSQGSQK